MGVNVLSGEEGDEGIELSDLMRRRLSADSSRPLVTAGTDAESKRYRLLLSGRVEERLGTATFQDVSDLSS